MKVSYYIRHRKKSARTADHARAVFRYIKNVDRQPVPERGQGVQ